MPKKHMVILAAILIFCTAAGIFLFNLLNRTTSSPVISEDDNARKWTADLRYVKKKLPVLHKNLFFYLSKDEFDSEMEELISKVDVLSDLEIKAGLARIVNSVRDSHTSVNIRGEQLYPFSFFEFEDGIYLTNASENYKELWGKKLVAVNGYDIDTLREKLNPYISQDNQAISKNQFCSLLTSLNVLKMAGVAAEEAVSFSFEGQDVIVKPLNINNVDNVRFLSDDSEFRALYPLPKKKDDIYWYQYDDKSGIVYVRYNSCSNMKDYSFSKFTRDVFDTVDSKNATTMVIDLRDNGGGNSMIFDPFIGEIKKHYTINNKDSLYVIVGRSTFSSAILNAMDLKQKTNATVIGEPTGGRPNHFGEVKVLHLSNVDLDIQYSSNYFKTTDEDTDSLYPDVETPLKAASYFKGQDDCLNYIYGALK